jgi:hypothetical protein
MIVNIRRVKDSNKCPEGDLNPHAR